MGAPKIKILQELVDTHTSELAENVSVRDFGAIGDGSDETQKFRDAIATGKRVIVPMPITFYGITSALVRSGEVSKVNLVGVGGIPEIRLIGTPSLTDTNVNSVFKPDGILCTGFRLRNLLLRGNWDGESATDFADSIGVWLTPSENYIPDIDNVWCENFADYGHYFYVNKGSVGRIYANENRVQGVAITNVEDSLEISYISAERNGNSDVNSGAGVDIEYSASRPIGLKNIHIGKISSNYNQRGVVVTSGSATDVILSGHGISYNDFNVFIDEITTKGNISDGLLIDFPSTHVKSFVSNDDGVSADCGILVRGTNPITRNSLRIDSIFTNGSFNGSYFTCASTDHPYKSVMLGTVILLNSANRGLYMGSEGWAVKSVIQDLFDFTSAIGAIVSNIERNVNILRGLAFGGVTQPMSRRTFKLPVPTNLAVSTEYKLAPNHYVERIVVHVVTASTTNVRMRVKVGGNTKADIRINTIGVRTIGLKANEVDALDTNTSAIGTDMLGDLRLEPLDIPWPNDGSVVVYVEYNSLY